MTYNNMNFESFWTWKITYIWKKQIRKRKSFKKIYFKTLIEIQYFAEIMKFYTEILFRILLNRILNYINNCELNCHSKLIDSF